MLTRSIVALLTFSVCSALPAISTAEGTPPQCTLAERRVLAVEPYRIDTRVGYGDVYETRGAQLYIQAEPGLTAAWLQLVLRRDLAAAGASSCALLSGDTRIEVVSVGPGYWVQLIASDAKSGEALLGRARQLLLVH